MAAPGKKKLVQQEELRRLMKVKQREAASKKRIESPLAKYNSLGHLSCVVCNVPIKSELLWQAHILGKQHKEKVAELKNPKVTTSNSSVIAPTSQATKRKGPSIESQDPKKVRDLEEEPSAPAQPSTLPAGFFEKTEQPSTKQTTINATRLPLLAGDYDDDDEEEKPETTSTAVPTSIQKATEIPLPPPSADDGLPPDFFDSKTPVASHSGSILKADIQEKPPMERKENTAEALPEGFFDDPEVDAKVRKVDAPKDHLDKEWEEFQKEIRQVNTVSEAIVAEEDEEGRLDRQIEEIDEQIECYRRIENLRDKKDVLNKSVNEDMNSKTGKERDDDESDDEEMLSVMIGQNWREKEAFL